MKKFLLVLVALATLTLPALAQNSTTTTWTKPSGQQTTLATKYDNATIIFPVALGITSHQVTYAVAPSVTGLTVTVSTSTGGTYATCGSASTALGGTITCTSTTATMVKVVYSAYAGSGAVDATYFGVTPLSSSGSGAVSSVSGDGVNITATPTTGDVIVSMSPYLTFINSSPSLSAANTGVLKYNSGTQTFQTSVNGGAFTSLASGSVTGSGTTGTLPLWSGTTALGDSIVTQAGTSSIAVAGSVNVNGTGVSGVALYSAETSSADPRGIMSAQYSTNAVGARIQFRKGRGTEAAPTTVVTGDVLGRLRFSGYDGTNYLQMGSIDVNSTGTIGSTQVPTTMVLSTATNASPSVLTPALTLGSDQSATFASSASLAGALTITQGSISAAPGISGTTTWNNSGVTFTALKWNVTDTNSAAASLLMDLQVGGTSKFTVAKTGGFTAGSGGGAAQLAVTQSGTTITADWKSNFGKFISLSATGGSNGEIDLGASSFIRWWNQSDLLTGGAYDLILQRDAANTLGLRNSTNAQTFNVYATYTDASNYRRMSFGSQTLAYESAGTGVDGSTMFLINRGNGVMSFGTNNLVRWNIVAGGDLQPNTDNAFNIGGVSNRVAAITGVNLKYGPSGSLTFSATAPTISSGFGSSPSITAGGSAAFRLNVGTGGSASTGVIALPTATTGWNCTAADVTTPDSFVTSQTSSTTTTASFTNYSRTTGTAIAWTASDILAVSCAAF